MATTKKTPGQIMREIRPIEAAIRRAVARAVEKPAARAAVPASRAGARRVAGGAHRQR
jgi:hypothetical protein